MNAQPAILALTAPRYTYSEADYLAGASRGTSRRWLSGYSYRDTRAELVKQPPVTVGLPIADVVSFLDLVEVVAIARFKDHGFSLIRVREIVKNCQTLLGVERPLVTLKFKTGAREIFVDRGDSLLEVGRRKGMQAWNEVLEPFLSELDYAHDLVSRWWPLGKQNPIVIDPAFGFGLPVIADSGVRTEIILERFKAGDLGDQIAKDFQISEFEVSRALQFEYKRVA